MAQNVNMTELIQELSLQLGKKEVELAMANLAIRNLETQLAKKLQDDNHAAPDIPGDSTAPDGR